MKRNSVLIRMIAAVQCAVLIISLGTFSALAGHPSFTNDQAWEVLRLTNEERIQNGLTPLSTFASLENAARLRAEETTVLFDHTRPDGSDCFTAISDISWSSAGENIAAGYTSPVEVVQGWMNSPGHRANILNGAFKHVGVGYVTGNTQYTHHWAQMFIGGCTTTGIALDGVDGVLQLSANSYIHSMGLMLAVTCNLHGTTYLPLSNASYTCDTSKIGETTMTIMYDGVSCTVPCYVNFSDVKAGSWYQEAVDFAFTNGLFEGTGASRFEPESPMTRAMLVTVLHRMEGTPAPEHAGSFSDVPSGKWYSEAVAWASENDIVNGIGANRFDPDTSVTREQMATILCRYSEFKGTLDNVRGNLTDFTDFGTVSPFAEESMKWAVGHGIINGKGNNLLDPKGDATRAQVATILMRYLSM